MSNESYTNTSEDVAKAIGLGTKQLAADVINGGQLGLGAQMTTLDAATPLALPPVNLVVLNTPTMFQDNPKFGIVLKALLESHAKVVSGINFGYTVETADQPIGHDGQTFKVPTQVKRSEVTPTFEIPELSGMVVWNTFQHWARNIGDPDSVLAMGGLGANRRKGAFMSSVYSMSMIAIQYDPTFDPNNIIDAAIYTNMFPTDPGGMIGFQRTIGETTVPTRTVTMTGIVQHNASTRNVGVAIANRLKMATVDYKKQAAAFTDVNEAIAASGLQLEIDAALAASAETA